MEWEERREKQVEDGADEDVGEKELKGGEVPEEETHTKQRTDFQRLHCDQKGELGLETHTHAHTHTHPLPPLSPRPNQRDGIKKRRD